MTAVDEVQASQAHAHAGVASIAFVLYDILLNLGDELQAKIELIWTAPNRWVKWLYMGVRYGPFVVLCSLFIVAKPGVAWTPKGCMIMQVYENVAIQSLTLFIELILLSRVYAMYSQNRILLVSLSAFLVAEVGSMVGILSVTVPKFQMTNGCIVTSTPRLFSFYWILPLAFETILLVLTLYKFATSVTGPSALGRKNSIMFVLMRDGTWAYGIIFGRRFTTITAAMLINAVFYAVETTPLAGVGFPWEIATLSFAGSHILLNTRRIAWYPERGTSFWARSSVEVSALKFESYGTRGLLGCLDVERPHIWWEAGQHV